MKKPFAIVFATLLVAHLALILSLRLYPFVDVPNHLAEATIYKYYGAPTNRFADYYTVDFLLKPNVLHPLFCSLGVFPSIEFANKVYFGLYVLLLPLSTLLVIRKLGGNPWFSLFSFLLLYNHSVNWGFVGFMISIPLCLLLFLLALEHLRGDRAMAGIALALSFPVLFLAHALAALYCLLLFFVLNLLLHWRAPWRALRKSVVTVPVLVVFAAWWAECGTSSTWPYLLDYYGSRYLGSVIHRGYELLYFDHFWLFEGSRGKVVAVFLSLCIVVPVLRRLAGHGREWFRSGERWQRAAVLALVVCSLGCFLFLPDRIPDDWSQYQRYSVFSLLSLAVLGSVVGPRDLRRGGIVLLSGACLVYLSLWGQYFIEFQQENRCFTQDLFPKGPERGTLMGIIRDCHYRSEVDFVYLHFPAYYIVWRQGVASTMMTVFKYVPVKVREDGLPLTSVLDNAYEAFDYLLTRGKPHAEARRRLAAFTCVREAGPWRLYKKKPASAGAPPAGQGSLPD